MLGERERELRTALRLGYFTVAWNLVEGLVAITAALLAGSQALLGFGLDSGIESLSAGVLIWRLQIERRNPHRAVEVERRALRLIGGTFFVVASFVAVDAVLSLVQQRKPDTSLLGIAVTVASLVVMPYLATGRAIARERCRCRRQCAVPGVCVPLDSGSSRAGSQCTFRMVVGRPDCRPLRRGVPCPRGS